MTKWRFKERVHIPHRLRNIAITASVLLAFMIIGGTVYTYVMDQGEGNKVSTATVATVDTESSSIKPVQPSVNAPEGAAIQMLSSPVAPGSDASMSVQTDPGSSCTIAVVYNKLKSTAAGLTPATADAYGSVSWNWTVETSAPLGTWPVNVTCTYHGHVGFVQGDLQITANGQ